MTKEQRVFDAFFQALDGAGIVPAGHVYQELGDSLPAQKLPAIDLAIFEVDTDEVGIDSQTHIMRLRVDLLIRESRAEQVPSAVAAPYLAAMHSALYEDRTLGGICRRIYVRNRRWNRDRANGQHMKVEGTYEVVFTTKLNSLE